MPSVGSWAGVTAALGDDTIEYNGVKFGGTDSLYKLYWPRYSINLRTEYDGAGAYARGATLEVSVESVLMPGPFSQTASEAVADELDRFNILKALMTPNKTIKIGYGSGLAALQSLSGRTSDISNHIWLYGVKTLTLSLLPYHGVHGALLLKWSFRAFMDLCPDPRPSTFMLSVRGASVSLQWAIDHSGRQVRTIIGEYFVSGVADIYREHWVFPVPLNMRRIQQSWVQSADRHTESFVIVDREFDGAIFPNYMTHATGSISLEVGGHAVADFNAAPWEAFAAGTMTINMAFEVSPEMTPWYGVAYAFNYINKQYLLLRTRYQSINPNIETAVIATRFNITRGLWEQERHITATAQFSVTGGAANGYSDPDLWNYPVQMPTWAEWYQKTTAPWRHRGWLGLKTDWYGVFATDQCNHQLGAGPYGISETVYPLGVLGSPVSFGECTNNLWLKQQSQVTIITDTNVRQIGRAASDNYPPSHKEQDPDYEPGVGSSGAPQDAGVPGQGEEFIFDQEGYYASTIIVDMVGYYQGDIGNIQFPVARTAEGKDLVPVDKAQKVQYKTVGNIFGCPVIQVRWQQEYQANGVIKSIKLAPAKTKGTDNSEQEAQDGNY